MPDIELWLKGLGLEKYAEVFARHDIDLEVVPSLSEQDLEHLGLSLGHRRKFLAAVAKLRAGGGETTDHRAQADSQRSKAAAVERRQVTVLFSDLVGSTALGTQLDPEDMLSSPSERFTQRTCFQECGESRWTKALHHRVKSRPARCRGNAVNSRECRFCKSGHALLRRTCRLLTQADIARIAWRRCDAQCLQHRDVVQVPAAWLFT